jgi:hypothetical protein
MQNSPLGFSLRRFERICGRCGGPADLGSARKRSASRWPDRFQPACRVDHSCVRLLFHSIRSAFHAANEALRGRLSVHSGEAKICAADIEVRERLEFLIAKLRDRNGAAFDRMRLGIALQRAGSLGIAPVEAQARRLR